MGENIRMNIKETAWESVEWIYVAQCKEKLWAVVNTVMNIRVV
jgi:hypothetical protein